MFHRPLVVPGTSRSRRRGHREKNGKQMLFLLGRSKIPARCAGGRRRPGKRLPTLRGKSEPKPKDPGGKSQITWFKGWTSPGEEITNSPRGIECLKGKNVMITYSIQRDSVAAPCFLNDPQVAETSQRPLSRRRAADRKFQGVRMNSGGGREHA
jgi:hypothetical protein